ncbi:MAG: GNAT family N-acetyltransferase [Flavobacteriales bacterium]|nr:GNAT family N-acetyltransferase [Flavobacteriales bacterium]
MIIRKAKVNELNQIMEVYDSCVRGMIELGIDQWDESYPNREVIKKDLETGDYYVGIINDEIVSGIKIDAKQDPTYLDIDWQDKTNNFMVVHRLCAKVSVWNKGVGKQMMKYAEKLALENKHISMRLDTYINNPKAIAFYKRIGYKQLGHINLKPHKDIYYCFEKML